MIEILINYINTLLLDSGKFSAVYPICSLIKSEEKEETYPAYFDYNTWNPIEFDSETTLAYIRKEGRVSMDPDDRIITGLQPQVRMVIPLILIGKAFRNDFGGNGYTEDVFAMYMMKLAHFINPPALRTSTKAATIECHATYYETNKDEIGRTEFAGNVMNIDERYILIAIGLQVEITGSIDCFTND